MAFATNSELQKLMTGITKLFCKYAGKEGCEKTLNMDETKDLLEKEIFFGIKDECQLQAMKEYTKYLDSDNDGIVTFIEFLNLITILTVVKNEKLKGCPCPSAQKAKK